MKHGKTFLRGAALMVATLGLAASSACSAATAPPDPSGVSDEMVEQSAQFRQDDGLFVMPESRGATRPVDYQATATYAPALERSKKRIVDRRLLAEGRPPASIDLVGADAYLRVREMIGALPDPAVRSQLVSAAVPPGRQPDLAAEVGALSTWTGVTERLDTVGGQRALPPEVEDRVLALDLGGLSGHPYLLARVAEIYTRLDMAEPEALRAMVAQVPATELPPPTSVIDVLDASAVVAARRASVPGEHVELPGEYVEQIQAVMALGDQVDDLARAHLITVLQDAGHQQDADRHLAELRDRVDRRTGLLRSPDVDHGTVAATYGFSRLLDRRFAEVADDDTVDGLRAVAADDGARLVDRLQAVAALQRAGVDGWPSLASTVAARVPPAESTVSRDGLDQYMAVMQPLLQIKPEADRSALEPFVPGDDEVDQKRAAAAMRDAYLFSNSDAVGSMFPEFQEEMQRWLRDPSTPFPQVVAAGGALVTSRIITVSSEEFDETSARIESRRGCPSASTFFSVDGSPDSMCSLLLTIQSRYASPPGR